MRRGTSFSSRMETSIWEEIIMLRNIDLDEISGRKTVYSGRSCEGRLSGLRGVLRLLLSDGGYDYFRPAGRLAADAGTQQKL